MHTLFYFCSTAMRSTSTSTAATSLGDKPCIAQMHAIGFAYPQRTIFHDFNASIPAGITWIGGDESSGKSTLLKLFAGELVPEVGRILRSKLGTDAQSADVVAYIDPKSEQFDPLGIPQFLAKMQERYTHLQVAEWTEMAHALGLADHLEKSIYMLSTGSKRKLFLATVLCAGAQLTLLDEPFAALDLTSVRKVSGYLQAWEASCDRACVIADYVPPANLVVAQSIVLPT